MRTFLFIGFFILTGIVTAYVVGFQTRDGFSAEYDDDQEKMRDQIVIKVSHVVSENTPKGKAVRRFKDLVEESTKGKVKVEIYPNGSLYSDISEWDALKNNNVQMIIPATSKVSQYVPEYGLFDLPFAFNSYDQVQQAFEGEIGKRLLEKVEKREGVKGVSFWYNGFKQITNNERPLITPADFNRLHFRTMPGEVIKDQYQAMGAAVSDLPFNKTYENLEVGFIDGQENTITNIYSKKLYGHQSYLTVSNHSYLGYVVLMNEEFWDGLPEEYQEEIDSAMVQTTDWIRRHSIEMNDSQMRELKRNTDLDVHILLNGEKKEWKETLAPLYEEYENVFGKDLMRELREINGSTGQQGF
ncbi:DctP family TRAP transporter solute-binding subunit [Rossellomorea aquimaris]|uniref:DctP family TRAP transporter solute-binding subunit n=1 Tax=Rossellomorea aquimaris TaxID=189382 RepID=UPI001CD65A7E|nr:DctP family TRAP transporter solute-binding subunit [Rossellomorea aquimaris]MCA1061398.1 DctP family TRAP transporter solute-binding subunit [Rossellomorea aquimaris]